MKEKGPRSTAALTVFPFFAAVLLGVTPAEASILRGGVAGGGPPSLALRALAPSAPPITPSPFGFAEGVSLFDVESAPGRFGLLGPESCRCEITYARNNPLKYVDPDGRAAALAPAVGVVGYVGGAIATYFILDHAFRVFTGRGIDSCVSPTGYAFEAAFAARPVLIAAEVEDPAEEEEGTEETREKARDRRAREQAVSAEKKHGDAEWSEPGSERYAQWKKHERVKAEGKAGGRRGHDEKKPGEPDRSKKQLEDDYRVWPPKKRPPSDSGERR